MLRWKRVEISAGALLLGAALYYLDEQGVLLMAFCACALHELGHWLVIRALGGQPPCASPVSARRCVSPPAVRWATGSR